MTQGSDQDFCFFSLREPTDTEIPQESWSDAQIVMYLGLLTTMLEQRYEKRIARLLVERRVTPLDGPATEEPGVGEP